MIEEQGRVIAVESQSVLVETMQGNSCGSCASKNACGEGLIRSLGLKLRCNYVVLPESLAVKVGDFIVIGIPEKMLVWSALLVYFLPLLGLLLGAVLAKNVFYNEPFTIAAGLISGITSWLVVRWYSRRFLVSTEYQPRVLRVIK